MAQFIKLLWVDDQISEYSKHIRKIEEYGFRIYAAHSPNEALHLAAQEKFDVIVSDLMMPGTGGFEFIKQVRKLQTTARYFILSGYLYENNYRESLREMWESDMALSVIDKPVPSPGSDMFEKELIRPLLRESAQVIKDKSFAQRIFEALEIKPGVGGLAIDLKALLFPSKNKNA